MDSLPQRKILPHEIPEWIDPLMEVYFITICGHPMGFNQLCVPGICGKLIESARFYHSHNKWFLQVFLLMPDHLHALISFPRSEKKFKATITSWKSFNAKTLKIIWQRDFFEHRLRSNESFREKAQYILDNPVRAGLVSNAKDWPHKFIGISW